MKDDSLSQIEGIVSLTDIFRLVLQLTKQ